MRRQSDGTDSDAARRDGKRRLALAAGAILATIAVLAGAAAWRLHPYWARPELPVADGPARLRIAPEVIGPVSRRVFGHNSVWSRGGLGVWDDARRDLKPDVVALVKELGPGVLRFPGGTRAMRYHFDAAIGPYAERMPQCDAFTGKVDATSFGLDEFMRFAASVGADATLVAPWVDGSPEEAAAMVAYANGQPDSTVVIGRDDRGKDWGVAGDWAKRRAAGGQAAPYGAAYVELGNEPYLDLRVPAWPNCGRRRLFRQDERWIGDEPMPTTARQYAEASIRAAALIRAIDAKVRIAAAAIVEPLEDDGAATVLARNDRELGTGDAWNATLAHAAGGAFDALVVHPYDLEHLWPDPLRLVEGTRRWVRGLAAVAPGKEVVMTEYGTFFSSSRFVNAVIAALMTKLAVEEHLGMALRHILIEDRPGGLFAKSAALLGHDGGDLRKMPGYHVMQLLSRTLAGTAYPLTSSKAAVSGLATVQRGEGGERWSVLVVSVNAHPDGRTQLELDLPPAASGAWGLDLATISAPALFASADDVAVERRPLAAPADGVLRLSVPAFSVNVLELGPASDAR
jgi:hypothetical protein